MRAQQTITAVVFAALLLACLAPASAQVDCNNPSNCYLCSYCSQNWKCSNPSQYGSDAVAACSCSYQCNGACKGFCAGPGGRRLLDFNAGAEEGPALDI